MALLEFEVKQNDGTFLADGQVGAALDVAAWDAPFSVQYAHLGVGTFTTGSITLQGSIDGVHFEDIATRTNNGIAQYTGPYAWLRIRTDHIVSDTPEAWLLGHVHSL